MAKEKIEPVNTDPYAGVPRVKVRIPLTRGGPEERTVWVNNYSCTIKAGETVEVPEFVAEVLDHADDAYAARIAYDEANAAKV